jgi:NAD(P)-dependent dehydrogenase (short-subunit alcohol dehydrogenase family)
MSIEPFVDFQGMRVVVTGASSGFGRAIAIELGKRGASLLLVGRDIETLKQTAAMVAADEIGCLVLDLRHLQEIGPRIRAYVQKSGRIYGLCHCAGIVETRPLAAMRTENVRELMDVNLLSGLELAKVLTRRDLMLEGGGAIVFISSIYAHVGVAGQIGYCGSKGAISAAARAMAVELARRKIRVNTLSPGLVPTPMTAKALDLLSEPQREELIRAYPLGIGTVEDVARAAVFLLAPQNRWMTGTDLVIDGGYSAQ